MQRLKNAIKKIATIGVGAAMLGATIGSAVALDLAEYPAPFVVNGEYDNSNAIVVGATAASSDTLGAIDIAARMQFDAKKAVSSAGGTLTATGGVAEDIPIGKGIANDTAFALDWELDDSDITSFQDTSVIFQGSDYNIHDALVFEKWTSLGKSSPSIETSLTSNEDDYETNVFMEVSSGAIRYYYIFDEAIIPNNATTSEPLELKFLGKTLKITKVESDTKFKAYVGNEYFMKVGDSVTVEGKKMTLSNVGSGGSIVVDVDGTVETIPASTTETINGIEIANDETFYEDTKSERSASLVIGTDAQGTFKDGDAFIGEDESNPNWVWIVNDLSQNSSATSSSVSISSSGISESGPLIGVNNDFTKDDAGDNPAGIGQCYDLPNNYASVCLDSLTVPDEDYLTLTIEYASGEDTSKSKFLLGLTSARTIKISAPGNERFIIPASIGTGFTQNGSLNDNDKKTSKIWLQAAVGCKDISMYYYDPDTSPTIQYIGNYTADTIVSARNIAKLNYKDTKDSNIALTLINASAAAGAGEWNITLDIEGDSTGELTTGLDDIKTIWECSSSGWDSLGDDSTIEEADELFWMNSQIGNKDEDHRSRYGVIIKDPKSNGASDQAVFEIPGDMVQANVVVKGQATTVAGGATSYVPAKIDVNPMLDSDVTDPTAHNLILVGGPCVNTLTASLGGLTCDGWKLASGEALIKLVNNGAKAAIIVAGTEAMDTRMACKVIANYEDYKLETTEQVVTGTISAPTIKTA